MTFLRLGAALTASLLATTAHATVLYENPWDTSATPRPMFCSPCDLGNPEHGIDQDTIFSFELQHDAVITGLTYLTASDPRYATGDLWAFGGLHHPGDYTKTDIGNGWAEVSLTFPGVAMAELHYPGPGYANGGYWTSISGVDSLNVLFGSDRQLLDGVQMWNYTYVPWGEQYWGDSVAFRLTGEWANTPVAAIPLPATLPLLAGALGALALIRRRR